MTSTSKNLRAADVAAVVLAGGRSSRFGSDKAQYVVDGKPMMQHVIDVVRPFVRNIVVVRGSSTDPKPNRVATGADAMATDIFADAGPLAGIHAGMLQAGAEWLLVVSCDLLHITPVLVAELLGHAVATVDAVIPGAKKMPPQYLCSLYRSSLLPIVEEQLRGGSYAVRGFVARIPSVYLLPWEGREITSVNTRSDLDASAE